MERRESEAQAQAAVFDWARWEQSQTPVLKAMYHAANEGKRSVRAGADLKRQGMKPGVSDICLPYAAGGDCMDFVPEESIKNMQKRIDL